MHRLRLLPVVCALGLLQPFGASPVQVDYPSFAEVVDGSDRIARVIIAEGEVATFQFGGEQHECGTVYTARVVDSLKGDDRGFSFLTRSAHTAALPGEFLVFAIDASALPPGEARTLSDYQRALIRCRLHAAPFLTSERLQSMIEFAATAPFEGSDSWLRFDLPSAISHLPLERVEVGDHEYFYARWSVVRDAISARAAGRREGEREPER